MLLASVPGLVLVVWMVQQPDAATWSAGELLALFAAGTVVVGIPLVLLGWWLIGTMVVEFRQARTARSGTRAASPSDPAALSTALDYDKWLHFDAEALAEGGIRSAYQELLPALREYVPHPFDVEELVDPEHESYAIRAGAFEYVVYSPTVGTGRGDSWGRAGYALCRCVNDQLANSPVRLYALYGGNDFGGMFLTPSQAVAARDSLPRRSDWPYLPDDEDPWYGQFHEVGP